MCGSERDHGNKISAMCIGRDWVLIVIFIGHFLQYFILITLFKYIRTVTRTVIVSELHQRGYLEEGKSFDVEVYYFLFDLYLTNSKSFVTYSH